MFVCFILSKHNTKLWKQHAELLVSSLFVSASSWIIIEHAVRNITKQLKIFGRISQHQRCCQKNPQSAPRQAIYGMFNYRLCQWCVVNESSRVLSFRFQRHFVISSRHIHHHSLLPYSSSFSRLAFLYIIKDHIFQDVTFS